MHVNLKFDCDKAEWFAEIPQDGWTLWADRHNTPLSVIVEFIRSVYPKARIDIDRGSLFAYHTHKATLS